ncbi:MAG: hypothetical protein ACI8Z7_000926 [Candidatus Nanohaloarchaea archaeon]
MKRSESDKTVTTALHVLLLISVFAISALLIPLIGFLEVFTGSIPLKYLIILPFPFLISYLLVKVKDGRKLSLDILVGNLAIGFSTAGALVSRNTLMEILADISKDLNEIFSSESVQREMSNQDFTGIIGNLNSYSVNVDLLFVISILAFNLPILYYIGKNQELKITQFFYIVLPASLYLLLRILLRNFALA